MVGCPLHHAVPRSRHINCHVLFRKSIRPSLPSDWLLKTPILYVIPAGEISGKGFACFVRNDWELTIPLHNDLA